MQPEGRWFSERLVCPVLSASFVVTVVIPCPSNPPSDLLAFPVGSRASLGGVITFSDSF